MKTNHTQLVRYFFIFLISLLLIPIGAQAETVQENDARPMGTREDKAFFRDSHLWEIDPTTGTHKIPVCWKDLNESSPAFRISVKAAVKNAWEGLSIDRNRGFSLVDFTGWEECGAADRFSVKIRVADEAHPAEPALKSPYVTALGTSLRAFRHEVVLNDTYSIFTRGDGSNGLLELCNNSIAQCIKTTAVHEFGHVLGMSHGNNRSDAFINSPTCLATLDIFNDPDIFQGTEVQGNSYFTDYDEQSIMNYCNKSRYTSQGLTPSRIDKIAVQAFYGEIPSFDVSTGILTIPRVELRFTTIDGFYNARLKHVADPDPNIIRFKLEGSVAMTTKPSTATALYSNTNLVLPLLKIIGPSGHIDQIAESINFSHQPDGTFTLNEGLQQLVNNRVQPLTFEPGSKY